MAWDGMILPANDPWWNTHYPPNGWQCHCTVEPVSRRDLKRYNWTVAVYGFWSVENMMKQTAC
ncbi:phage minor head protein [Acetobacter orientalis]|nr:phage minor head protein [Acetobacter orientalis]MCP1220026.1 phage minor head protein [Acetobacter orientalis]